MFTILRIKEGLLGCSDGRKQAIKELGGVREERAMVCLRGQGCAEVAEGLWKVSFECTAVLYLVLLC